MTFHVGQKVVCINDDPAPIETIRGGLIINDYRLRNGNIYTIRETGLLHPHDLTVSPCVRLEEITRRPVDNPFWASRFRPVIERKTDISLFQKLLIPQRDQELV